MVAGYPQPPPLRPTERQLTGLRCRNMATDLASPDAARLAEIRHEVASALDSFLGRQRAALGAIGDDLLPCLLTMQELLAGGKRLRPAFCYWGWRAADGQDCPEIYAAAASLELLQASALVHDDVMDASDTRRGQPAVHRQFSARLAAANPDGAEQFGTAAAILIGDMLLSWSDQMYHASGFPADALQRGQQALGAMQTEVAAGQYLDILSQATRSTSVARGDARDHLQDGQVHDRAAAPAGSPASGAFACRR